MMQLRTTLASPFGRKARIAAAMLGLDGEITLIEADLYDPHDPLRVHNPLGKVPTLVLEDGAVLFDSRVILDYLDHRAGGGRLIPAAPARFRALTRAALAEGILDAAVLQVYEGRYRPPERHEPSWLEHQGGKVARALATFEGAPPQGARTIEDVTLACALGYLDLRFEGRWRGGHPGLVSWLDGFAAEVSSFGATRFRS